MMNTILTALRNYNNRADLEDLRERVNSGSLRILFEFNSSDTLLYYQHIKSIFNLKNIVFVNQINNTRADDIDAVFILCPYDRADRLKAVSWGIKNQKPIYVLEAGFISSIYPLSDKESPISFHVDSTGSLYLDGDGHNEVINYLNSEVNLDLEQLSLSKKIINLVCENGLSKYNNSTNTNQIKSKGNVLIIDQTLNDFSITLAEASQDRFQEMVDAAISTYPDKQIYIKVHPEVLSGSRKGNIFLENYMFRSGVHILAEPILINELFKSFDIVFTVSSTLGFEALLYGKEVHCFGKTFYGGWGLTVDHVKYKNRSRTRPIEDLVYALYVRSNFYVNVETGNNDLALPSIISFVELIGQYRKISKILDYQLSSLKAQLSVLQKEIKITQTKLSSLSTNNISKSNLPILEATVPKKEPAIDKKKPTKKNNFSIEDKFIKCLVDERRYNKYKRDRDAFFEDSSNIVFKLYWKFLKRH